MVNGNGGAVAAVAAGAAVVSAPPSGITPEVWASMTPEARAAVSVALQNNRPVGKLTLRVSAKGAVSVYGLGRWPVTLYASQWRALLAKASEITAFMAENAGKLSAEKPGN